METGIITVFETTFLAESMSSSSSTGNGSFMQGLGGR